MQRATAHEGLPYRYADAHPHKPQPGFRVTPYLQKPSATTMSLNFFGELGTPARVELRRDGHLLYQQNVSGTLQPHLGYTEAEVAEEIPGLEQGSWLRSNHNFKYSVSFSDLQPTTRYEYRVVLDGVEYRNAFATAPPSQPWSSDETAWTGTRLIAFADTETWPAGRASIHGARPWESTRTLAQGSLDRPKEGSQWFATFGGDGHGGNAVPRYPLTKDQAMRYNVQTIAEQHPDLLLVAGDLVQGSGYQPAWDEYWRYFAGEVGDLAGSVPMLTALGNWETYAGINGGYHTNGIAHGAHKARRAYQTYVNTFGSDTPEHAGSYYRVDHGPLTIITLDSTNGLPDEEYGQRKREAIRGNDRAFEAIGLWGTDTNTCYTHEGIRAAGNTDQPDFNPGSAQWIWAQKQLADARRAHQVIIVQFHHTPYSSGIHGTTTTSATPCDQPGSPMRVYSPMFEHYGVVLVLSGHDEMFERSFIDNDGDGVGFHNIDVGVAADGLRGDYRVADEHGELVAVEFNSYREWMAHADEPELWVDDARGTRQLVNGGKHYGHLQIDITPGDADGPHAMITTTPVHLFPVLDSDYALLRVERRVYADVQTITIDQEGRPLPRTQSSPPGCT